LMYWAPLIALLVLSLGLVALKRISALPPWLERLAAPPFYLVSLPVATLLACLEVLVWYALCTLAILALVDMSWSVIFFPVVQVVLTCTGSPTPLVALLAAGISFIGFCAAPFVSGYLLWRTLWHKDERECPSNRAKQRRRAVLPLFVFVCAFVVLRYVVLFLWGSGVLHILKLRVIWTLWRRRRCQSTAATRTRKAVSTFAPTRCVSVMRTPIQSFIGAADWGATSAKSSQELQSKDGTRIMAVPVPVTFGVRERLRRIASFEARPQLRERDEMADTIAFFGNPVRATYPNGDLIIVNGRPLLIPPDFNLQNEINAAPMLQHMHSQGRGLVCTSRPAAAATPNDRQAIQGASIRGIRTLATTDTV